MTSTFKHPAGTCSQWEHVPRLNQLLRPCLWVRQQSDGNGAIKGADPGGNASGRIYTNGKIRAVRFAIIGHHWIEAETFQLRFQRGNTDNSAAVTDHHIDRFRGSLFRHHDEVALVFPVFIVRHDNETT